MFIFKAKTKSFRHVLAERSEYIANQKDRKDFDLIKQNKTKKKLTFANDRLYPRISQRPTQG